DRLDDGENGKFPHFNLGIHLEAGDELEILAGLVGEGLDAGLAGGADVLLLNGVLEALADDLADDFLAHTGTVALANHLEGNLAGAETIQTHGSGGLLQARGDFVLHLLGGHADGHAALEAGSCLYGNLHGCSSTVSFMKIKQFSARREARTAAGAATGP